MVTALPGTALATDGQTRAVHTTANSKDLAKIVENANDGDIIEISGTCMTNDTNSNAPWVINKKVTIRGATTDASLNLRSGGIILAADVTFENLELAFPNRVRNAIMANGHTLILRNVTRSKSANNDVHLFCGGATGLAIAAQPGGHGNIIIENCPEMGNVYAGSISTDGDPNESSIPATVTMIGTSKAGDFYACGALETYVPGDEMLNPNYEVAPPKPSTERFRVTRDVTFNLYYTSTSMVDGATGGDKNAAVVYTGKGNLNDGLTLDNLSSLTVGSGEELKPKTGSSLDGAELVVPASSVLHLTNLTNPVFAGLQGGGDLVLDQNQTLTINGSVSGKTRIGIGNIFNGASTTAPALGHVYVSAPQSADGDFELICQGNNLDIKLVRDSSGDWTAQKDSPEEKPPSKLVSLAPGNVQLTSEESADSAIDGISIPLNTVYTGDELSIDTIPLIIHVKDNGETQVSQDEAYGYCYETNDLRIFTGDTGGGNGEELWVYSKLNNGPDPAPVPDGVYQFEITVPGAYTASGKNLSTSCTLTVGNNVTPPPTTIPVPTANTGLKWTGGEQTGVEEGTGYTLTGHKGTNVGSYTATATLKSGYVWNDGSTTAKSISWSIAKADGPAAPTSLSAVPPTSAGGADGKILGVTAAMEYASHADFSDAQSCTGTEIVNLTPKVYFVRLRSTQRHEAGAPASITVPDFDEPTVVSIRVNSAGHKTNYELNSPLDVTGLTIEAVYSDQSTQTVPVTENMVSGFDSSTAGSKPLTITYEGRQTTYTVEVAAAEQPGPNHIHDWSASWSSDSRYHWHDCQAEDCPIEENREKEGYGSHNAGPWITDQAATSSRPGSRHKECTVCRYVTVRETIPATGGGSGSSGGGGSYIPPTYRPDVPQPSQGGSVSVSPSSPVRGDPVTVTPKPDQGYEVDKITVTDQNGKPVEVTVKPDGTYTFKQPNGKVKIEVTYKPVRTPWSSPFTDVSEGDWYYEAVQFVQAEGLMSGYGSGNFAPDAQLSRAQLAQILFNKEGRPGVNYLLDFSDLAGEAWYTEAVRWAASQGIVGGYGNGTFGPNDPITREQLAVMLWRYSGSPAATNKELHFSDEGEISAFAREALRWAVENGILNGYDNGRLGPQGQATRAQAAQMLKNFIENQEDSAIR
ncbi:MAG: S-layer homology domain-containing protein [Oscillospiraceae bacterium]|nr:S-layer homology domain-containing protein [Oscillospiraceae bacterium]